MSWTILALVLIMLVANYFGERPYGRRPFLYRLYRELRGRK